MTFLQSNFSSPVISPGECRVPSVAGKSLGVFACLILSKDCMQAGILQASAEAAGWQVTVSDSIEDAVARLARLRFGLAIIDFSGDLEEATLRDFTESIIPPLDDTSAGPLVVACGREGDLSQEFWSYQVRVWLYLAGINQDCDLVPLCVKAKQVALKLNEQALNKSAYVAALN